MSPMDQHHNSDLTSDQNVNNSKPTLSYSDNGMVGLAHGSNGELGQVANFSSQGKRFGLINEYYPSFLA